MIRRHGKQRAAGRSTPRRRLVRRLLAVTAVLVALWTGLWALNRPIRAVTVSGGFRHVSPLAVERVVAPAAAGAGILTVNLARVRVAVDALPWVVGASVRRVWPDALAVRVHEQVAFARWNGNALVNRDGVRFVTGTAGAAAGLPSLSGPTGTEAQVTRRYRRMSEQLAPEGFSIRALALDARGTWQFTLNDGITVRLGRSQIDERFEKFVNVALLIVKRRAGDISYIDMRYMNGFAIGWRTGRVATATSARTRGPGTGLHRKGQLLARPEGDIDA